VALNFELLVGTNKIRSCLKPTLQSIAYQVRDVIDTMKEDTGIDIPLLKVDGVRQQTNDLLLAQFQADIFKFFCSKGPRDLENNALGAAFLAGLAVGFWERFR